jgi:formylglycine-generating enzyme required for sulfatase activity
VAQRLRWIPPGRFVMGSPESEAGRWPDEGPQHPVTIDRGFWLADTPVTQALWQAVMGENPSHFKGLERPVERVSWQDAQAFFQQAKVAGLGLPTEAQWEYACRAGTPTATWRGDDPAVRTEIAWFDENSKGETQPVKTKPANPLGLYDMLGNVWEWCADPWRASYASTARESAASERVVRGGAWGNDARYVRAAFRAGLEPAHRSVDLGFRLALQPAEPGPGGAAPGGRPREAELRGRRS